MRKRGKATTNQPQPHGVSWRMGYILGVKLYGDIKTPVTTDMLRQLAANSANNVGQTVVVDQGEFIAGFYQGWRDARIGEAHANNSKQATGDQ